jgi:cysteinyl-tRNA synthetase
MLTLFNTLTRKKEEFKPLHDKQVLFYQCGPTVYWTQHLGNLRAMLNADFIIRTLKYLDYKVKFVRNYTDVGHLTSDADTGEDKLEKANLNMLFFKCTKCDMEVPSFLSINPEALKTLRYNNNQVECTNCHRINTLNKKDLHYKKDVNIINTIAEKYIEVFEKDLTALNIKPADYKPRATECIPEIISMVKTLLDHGYAYATPLAVYFDVTKAKDYTRLSKQNFDKNIKDAGKGTVSDPEKKHPADFALWFFKAGTHKNAMQYWPSPFISAEAKNGEGFPGWHIECSVMSKKYLSETIDIHMGGIEHIPVHHTNEIAQSEAANGQPFVRYWLHNEHLLVDNAKMAKSTGTGYTLREIIDKGFDPLAFRYFVLGAHYRSKLNFTWNALETAQIAWKNLCVITANLGEPATGLAEFEQKFIEVVSDDFNTPQALAVIWNMLGSNNPPGAKKASLLKFDKILGLNLGLAKPIQVPEEIKKLAQERESLRQQKKWSEADAIRDEITRHGFQADDTPAGPVIKKK